MSACILPPPSSGSSTCVYSLLCMLHVVSKSGSLLRCADTLLLVGVVVSAVCGSAACVSAVHLKERTHTMSL
jgi:hypothetical protein